MTEEQRRQRADMITRLVNDEHYVPMKVKEMAILLGVSREDVLAAADAAYGKEEQA